VAGRRTETGPAAPLDLEGSTVIPSLASSACERRARLPEVFRFAAPA
jgi:hypothetical protein